MPDDLSSQIPLIKEIISGYGFSIIEKEGFEADDIIAGLSRQAASSGIPVTIVSSDKDMLQLVSDDILVLNPYKGSGLLYGKEEVFKDFGVAPAQIPDVLSLTGDAADNIPGIPGIGEKTAVKLILEFGSLDKLLNNINGISNEKIKGAIKGNIDRVRLNKELIFLSGSLNIGLDLEKLKLGKRDSGKLASLFRRLEFKRFLATLEPEKESFPCAPLYECRDSELKDAFCPGKELFLSVDNQGVFFYFQGKAMRIGKIGANFKKLLSDPRVKKVGHDLKKAKVILGRESIAVNGLYFDTMIAAYLLNPSRPGYDLESIAMDFLDPSLLASPVNPEKKLNLIRMLMPELENKLKEKELFKLFTDIEMPLADVLAQMELYGVKLDLKLLTSLSKELEKRLKSLMRDIYELSGSKFNINSPKQLRVILFEVLKLPVIKRTKTGPSTDEEVLSRLSGRHRLPELLLEYRQLTKLKTTYIDPLPSLVDSRTGRLHTSFNQCATETGRLSSSNPNLQNIPVRTEIGSKIRRGITASDKNGLLVSCDYSQIELRILAHLSKDINLVTAFNSASDIHKITAGLIYGVRESDVTDQMRDTAKRVNFGIVYGLTSFGLSRDLGISIGEAQAFIEAYFLRYPKVRDYIEEEIKIAEKKGFVTTILGRRRYIPEINSKNMSIRQFAQRQAVNTPIQGSASDLIKLAMINIQADIEKKSLRAKMVLQVHDELLFDLPKEELSSLVGLARDKMEKVLKLDVPVVVDIKQGANWLEMKEV